MKTVRAEVSPRNVGKVHLSRDGKTTLCGNAVGKTLNTDAFLFFDSPSSGEHRRCGSCTRLAVAALRKS